MCLRGEESITYANVRNVPVVKEIYGLVGGQFALQVGLCEIKKKRNKNVAALADLHSHCYLGDGASLGV